MTPTATPAAGESALRASGDAPAQTSTTVRRRILAHISNAVLPGTGLILIGRGWTGAMLAVLFGVCAHVTIAGFVIAPLAWPGWIVWTAVAMACGCWILALSLARANATQPNVQDP